MPKRRTQNVKLSSVKRTIVKSHRKENGRKVRKMLAAVMESQQPKQMNGSSSKVESSTSAAGAVDCEEFYSSGRTGRRNALPDILGENAHVTSSDLPARLQALTTSTDQERKNQNDSESGPSTARTQ